MKPRGSRREAAGRKTSSKNPKDTEEASKREEQEEPSKKDISRWKKGRKIRPGCCSEKAGPVDGTERRGRQTVKDTAPGLLQESNKKEDGRKETRDDETKKTDRQLCGRHSKAQRAERR